MPLDAITLSALAKELNAKLEGAKIDKIQQPERMLHMRFINDNC